MNGVLFQWCYVCGSIFFKTFSLSFLMCDLKIHELALETEQDFGKEICSTCTLH